MNEERIFRIIVFWVFAITVGISSYYRRKARQSSEVIPRRKEGKAALFGRGIMGLVLAGLILSYSFFPDSLEGLRLSISLWLRWTGAVIAALCPVLTVWLFKHIGSNISETVLTKKNHQLVTSGPYRRLRHPLYSTGSLLIISLGLTSGIWLILLLGILAAILFRLVVIPIEEEKLIEKFGDQYKSYQKQTGALLPKLRK